MGQAVGDERHRTVARGLQANLSPDAKVARLGGDEFAVILPGLRSDNAGTSAVAGILEGVADPLIIDESVVHVSISAGAAMWPSDGADAEEILKRDRKSTRLNSSH